MGLDENVRLVRQGNEQIELDGDLGIAVASDGNEVHVLDGRDHQMRGISFGRQLDD
jgi:hypothetical protein